MTPDVPLDFPTATTALTAEGWGSVPRTYIACSSDRVVRPPLQRLFVTEADRVFPEQPSTVLTSESGHLPFLSAPEPLAAAIAEVA